MNFSNLINLLYLTQFNCTSYFGRFFNFSLSLFNNKVFNKYPFLKIITLIVSINLIYRTFIYFIFMIIKSVFPIVYMYFILNQMDKRSDQKPISKLIEKIKNDNKEASKKNTIIDTLENQMNQELGIRKDIQTEYDLNFDQV